MFAAHRPGDHQAVGVAGRGDELDAEPGHVEDDVAQGDQLRLASVAAAGRDGAQAERPAKELSVLRLQRLDRPKLAGVGHQLRAGPALPAGGRWSTRSPHGGRSRPPRARTDRRRRPARPGRPARGPAARRACRRGTPGTASGNGSDPGPAVRETAPGIRTPRRETVRSVSPGPTGFGGSRASEIVPRVGEIEALVAQRKVRDLVAGHRRRQRAPVVE